MEITEKGGIQQIPCLVKNKTGSAAGETEMSVTGEPRGCMDKVVLSPRARELHDAKKKIMGIDDIRNALVSDLRHRIDSGTYRVKGDKIAFNMIKESILNQVIRA